MGTQKKAFLQIRTETEVHRRRLCFLYGNALIQLQEFSTADKLLAELYKFNAGFSFSSLKKVFHSCNLKLTNHKYKFTDEIIERIIGPSYAFYVGHCKKDRDAIRYKQKKDAKRKAGTLKSQQMENRREKVKSLLLSNQQIPAVAKACKVSVATMNRDIKQLKNKLPNTTRGRCNLHPLSLFVSSDCL